LGWVRWAVHTAGRWEIAGAPAAPVRDHIVDNFRDQKAAGPADFAAEGCLDTDSDRLADYNFVDQDIDSAPVPNCCVSDWVRPDTVALAEASSYSNFQGYAVIARGQGYIADKRRWEKAVTGVDRAC
jgi:hypothetical protein